ncbi:hypothetical protein IKZ77_00070, partial [Candidatus Saccharibacteria bacterium]|nr:hypothetical protein [Candidatus Saccharibacteria bacterium]
MTTGDMAISIGGLVISGLTIISSSLVAVFQPIHNHKKTKSHDKQWDVISEIYKKLADTDLDISICLSPIQCKESQVDIEQKAIDSFDSFSRYYLENKIYI